MRAGRHHGHGQRAALALLRARGRQPGVRLLLPAHQGHAHGAEARAPQGAARPVEGRTRHDQGLRRRLQRVSEAHGSARFQVPALRAPDHGARRVPAHLPAQPARQLGQLPQRDRGRRAAERRRERRPRGSAGLQPPPRPGEPRLQRPRHRPRRRQRRARAAAQQHALPVAGLRALVRDPHDDPRQAERDRGRAPGRAGRQPRLHPRTSRGATRSPPHGASRRTSWTCARAGRPSTWSTAAP